MGDYILMHKDLEVCYFSMENAVVTGIAFNKQYLEHIPLSVTNKHSMQIWLMNRAIPATRFGVKKITENGLQFMLENYGLSLSDCYWIRPIGVTQSWESVNFFTNTFHATAVLEELTEMNAVAKLNFTPSASLNGDLEKKWVINAGKRVLLKGNSGNTALQSVSEVLTSKIYEKQSAIPFTRYKFAKIISDNREILGCACEDFANENIEFIPAIDILNSCKKPNDKSYYQMFVHEGERRGLSDVERFLSNMFFVDFYMVNQDRHLNNFGILRNPDTLEWISMTPVFDSGNSLFYRLELGRQVPNGEKLLNTQITSFTRCLSVQLKLVNRNLVEIDTARLPSESEIYDILRKDISLQEFDIEQRLKLLRSTKQCLFDFLNGADLWSYEYKRSIKNMEKF